MVEDGIAATETDTSACEHALPDASGRCTLNDHKQPAVEIPTGLVNWDDHLKV